MHDSLDEHSSRLLAALDRGLPLTLRPYDDLGTRAGIAEAESIATLRYLRSRRVIARIGAAFSPAALGYHAALGALAVPEDRVEATAAYLEDLPNVTQVFELDDRYRVWYAIVTTSRARLDITETEIAAAVKAADRYRVLPDEVFKITAAFDADGAPEPPDSEDVPLATVLDRDEKALVRLLRGELPVTERPFSALAITLAECGYDVDERWVLERTRELVSSGVVRGLGMTLRRRPEPWRSALSTWVGVTEPAAGAVVASFPEVIHCYTRRVPGAGSAVLALVEGPDRSAIDQTLARVSALADLDAPRVVYPVREFKRAPMRYFAEGEG
jgi:DNA-binding Lrp family transcriptional regulator